MNLLKFFIFILKILMNEFIYLFINVFKDKPGAPAAKIRELYLNNI